MDGKEENFIRLQKFLAHAGVCSRREGERFIQAGRVRVNGRTVTELGAKIDPGIDSVEVDGQPVRLKEKPVYILLNKPAGYISSCRHADRKIVLDLVDVPQRIYPVGRLDMDSTGLLLLTNDGRLHHCLSHPSFDHEKEYLVAVDRPIPDTALREMAGGIALDGKKTRPAHVERVSGDTFRITLREGRNRQIRRMAEALGFTVTRLHRLRMANLTLGNLPAGKWRHLTAEESEQLVRLCGVAGKKEAGNQNQESGRGSKT